MQTSLKMFSKFFLLILLLFSSISWSETKVASISDYEWSSQQKKDLTKVLDEASQIEYSSSNYSEIADDDLLEKLRGAFFICNPYCEFSDFLFSPGFIVGEKTLSEIEKVRYIDKNDPAFLGIFFDQEALKRALRKSEQNQRGLRRFYNQQMAQKEMQEREKIKGSGFVFDLGLNFSSSSFSSNGSIQQNLGSGQSSGNTFAMAYNPTLLLFFWKKFQFNSFLRYEMTSYGSRAISNDSISLKRTRTLVDTYIHYRNSDFWGKFGIGQDSLKVAPTQDFVTAFASDVKSQVVEVGFGYREYLFKLKTALTGGASETQDFRASPYKQSWNAFEFDYCRPISDQGWRKEFLVCGELELISRKETTGIVNNLNTGTSSELSMTQTNISAVLVWGLGGLWGGSK